MSETDKEDGISYFDVACEKHGFLRKYLHYLNPFNINIVLLSCSSYMKQKEICDQLNKVNPITSFNVSSLRRQHLIIRNRLYSLERYAKIFQIDETIKQVSLSALQRIVSDHFEKKKEAE